MAQSPSPHSALPAAVNRTGQLVELLAGEIRDRKYRPGERLPTEQAMVALYGISRTVVREAVASLRAQGLLVARQGVGVFVAEGAATRPFRIVSDELGSLCELLNVMQLRLAVEVEAASLAAAHCSVDDLARLERALKRIDEAIAAGRVAIEEDFDFHVAIATATGNPQFERFLRFLGTVIIPRQTLKIGTSTTQSRLRYLRRLQLEHRAIHKAILARDMEAARQAARTHLENARRRYTKLAGGTT